MIHSFLLIGQSNMAGRGHIANAPKLDNLGGRLKVLRNGRWQPMFRPVNPDRHFSGTCLAESFAKAYADDHPSVEVGIIPCADGGTSLDQWAEGSLLFDNAVNNARLAIRTSHLAGILWHQGESDCSDSLYPLYLKKLTAVMCAIRCQLNAENIPLLVGGLGDFLPLCDEVYNNAHFINEALISFAEGSNRTAFVSAEGLTPNSDNLHFCHDSLMEFGLRYYKAFKDIENPNIGKDEGEKLDDSKRNALEAL